MFEKTVVSLSTPKINIKNPSPSIQLVRQQMEATLTIFFSNAALDAGRAAKKKAKKVKKADDASTILLAALLAIAWGLLVSTIASILELAAKVGEQEGIAQLGLTETEVSDLTAIATKYANERAAELVGMKFVDGKLVDNPDAEWAISQTTRDDLKDLIEKAIAENLSPAELETAIQESTTFSAERARLIARTETAMAQAQGNLSIWKQSGKVNMVNVELSQFHAIDDICDAISASGPYPIEDSPEVPIHPNCMCSLVAVS